jgi:hypothetical protein
MGLEEGLGPVWRSTARNESDLFEKLARSRLSRIYLGENPENADYKTVASINVEPLGLRRPFPVGIEFVGERTVMVASEAFGQQNITHGEGARDC